MNWKAQDLDTYMQQKMYIDTLLVPLLPIETTADRAKNSASSAEFLMHLTNFIEGQFKGRMMVLPPLSYTQSTDYEAFAKVFNQDFEETDFKHIFYVTTDRNWVDIDVNGEVIWLPSIPLESMEPKLRQSVMEDQLRQVLPTFTKKWAQ